MQANSLFIPPTSSLPLFLDEANSLISQLASFSMDELRIKEKLSASLARSMYELIHRYSLLPTQGTAAIAAYTGHVYDKLEVSSLTPDALSYLSKHLGILSALYGLLRPYDLIKTCRLDMESKLIANLYGFWREKITLSLKRALEDEQGVLVNLASNEYFKMVDLKRLGESTQIITPVFLQEKNGQLKNSSMYTKFARGLMTRFMAENQIDNPEHLQAFDAESYSFSPSLSNDTKYVFIR